MLFNFRNELTTINAFKLRKPVIGRHSILGRINTAVNCTFSHLNLINNTVRLIKIQFFFSIYSHSRTVTYANACTQARTHACTYTCTHVHRQDYPLAQ